MSVRYIKPGRADAAMNRVIHTLTRLGMSVWGSRVLTVPGRRTGEPRSVPVNLLTLDGRRYLVAPRGTTQWVRNLRATDGGQLRVGRRLERFGYRELADDEKPAVLRAYLRRWKFEVAALFDGVDATARDERLREIAPGYPIFEIHSAG